LYEEGCAVARASGVAIDGGLWEQLLRVCERTAGNRSSMLQDVLNGRRTEIDWINGHLIRLADRFGMAAPANRAVFNRIKSLETAKNRECAIS
jgi:2-dehydropantoate 2-reductase